MITVQDAKERIYQSFQPIGPETISLAQAAGRILAESLFARRTQPPANVSAMDGYAVRIPDCLSPSSRLRVIGSAPAGQAFNSILSKNEAVRIFTGAVIPEGADTVVIQENTKLDNDLLEILQVPDLAANIRLKGQDFFIGQRLYEGGELLMPRDIALIAAMNIPWLQVRRKPRIAILATGDELVLPGDPLERIDQIVSTNSLSIAALVKSLGGDITDLGILPDDLEALQKALSAAQGHDLLITLGGASVGEHDIIRKLFDAKDSSLDFWKIAMRPGKPLLMGRWKDLPILGLPGNPVSALMCGMLFLPAALAGLTGSELPYEDLLPARLMGELKANDLRQDYMRAEIIDNLGDESGALWVQPFPKQDSSMLSTLARADVLIVRPPHDPARHYGEPIQILPLTI